MNWYIFVSFVVLFVLLFCGLPVPIVFFGTALFLLIFGGYAPSFLFPYAYSQVASMTCMTLPLFIIAGGIIEIGGIGENLIAFVDLFLGRVKGGLGFIMIVTCAVFSAISGSSYACETVIGSIMLPRMRAAGYDDAISASLLASSCMLGSYIPPSGMMLIYAWITSQSVLACFLCTIVPGVMIAVAFGVWTYLQCRKNPNIIVPEKLPLKLKTRQICKVTWHAIPALLFPIIVLGGIYSGVMTPSEAAAISILYAIPVALFVYRKSTVKDIAQSLVKTGTNSGTILLMLFCVSMISRIYLTENLPEIILSAINTFTTNRVVIIIMINLFLVFLGLLMDDASASLLSTPILMPIMRSLGVDPVHYAAIVAVNLGMGCVSPPCAPLLFMAAKVGDTSLTKMLKPNFSLMFFVWLPMIILVNCFPVLALGLPRLILGYGA